MTAQSAPAPTAGRAGHRQSPPAEQRGTTEVPAKVVSRIAEQAASEVPGIGAAAGGVLGIGARRDFDARPTVTCELYGRTAVLHLDVGLGFPTPLGPALQSLRDHVSTRVETLTGIQVGRLDVDVSWLHAAEPTRRQLR